MKLDFFFNFFFKLLIQTIYFVTKYFKLVIEIVILLNLCIQTLRELTK